MHTKSTLLRLSVLLAMVGGVRQALQAQSSAPASSPPAATPPSDVTVMSEMTVNGVPTAEQVLPTVRPVGDVTGDDANILDIPRSVSSVNEAWMQDRMVKNAMDFGQFSPGVYSAAQYGIPAVPFIRGDLGQMYVDGQIIPFSRNSTPPSFNGIEAMDIVKGPGSAVYGPQGEGAGGYVDFVMKQPYFDTFHGDITATYGDWTSGHSYSNPEATIDLGGPLTSKLAYRISYLSRYGDGYYINDHDQTQDVYAALTFLPNPNVKIEGWAQIFSDRTNEITGANRVTQQFIWNGSYIAGPASPVTTGPNAYFGYDIATPGTPASPDNYGTNADGTYQTVTAASAHVVKLPDYDALIGPSDTARSKLAQGQVKTTIDIGPDAKLVDRAYFALGDSEKFETYGYDEYVPRQESIQDRLEFHDTFSTGPIGHQFITGADFRYQELISYQDFTSEPFSNYDLSAPLSKVFYPGYYYEGMTWGGGEQIPNKPGYSTNASSPDTGGSAGSQWSYIYDSALFAQDEVKLTPKMSLIPGYRIDRISADTANPPVVEVGYEAFYTYYPLTTPIYIPRGHSSPLIVNESAYGLGTHPTYEGYNVDGSVNDQSYFLSWVYKLTDATSVYATYDHVDAILGSANFGGVDVNGNQANVKTSLDNDLTTTSTLYEIGYKESFLHNALYFSAGLFQQIKYGAELTGQTYPIKDDGVELESVYQPSKQWTLNANFAYQNATAFGTSFYQQTGNYLDNFATTTPVDGTFGTGLGGPNFTSYSPPTGRMRAPGIPQVQGNFFAEYKNPTGWGVGAGPQYIGRQYANDQDTLHIPGEYEMDGYVFYGQKRWDVRVNVKNMFNHRLLDPIDVTFAGNDTVFVRPPISASITFRYHF
jgi:outer membrane receptor for ferric coprogen and ferric-rhodotorulic acid